MWCFFNRVNDNKKGSPGGNGKVRASLVLVSDNFNNNEGSVMNPDPSKANKIVCFTNAQKVEYQTLVTGTLMTLKIKRVLVDFKQRFEQKVLD